MNLFDLVRIIRPRPSGDSQLHSEVRQAVLVAVLKNPISVLAGPVAEARLRAGEDASFDELGLDSLARLTLAIDLNSLGYPISEVDIDTSGGVEGLTRFLVQRWPGVRVTDM
jgi:acyl carrier protein